MAQTYTKNYNADTFSELVSDLQTTYAWYNVTVSDDGLTAEFFINENVAVQILLSGKVLDFKIMKSGTVITRQSANYFLTSIVKTSKVFCFTITPSNNTGNILPTGYLYNIIIGTAVNQLTKVGETALAYAYQYGTSNITGYIISSDNITEPITANQYPWIGTNFGTKITVIQNFFYKYSECIMKDIYILLASQLSSLSFNDCTLNGKKYYMNGAILLADD